MAVVNASVLYTIENEIMAQQKFDLRIVQAYMKYPFVSEPEFLVVHYSAKILNCVFQEKCEKSILDMQLKQTQCNTPNVLFAKTMFESKAQNANCAARTMYSCMTTTNF